MCLDSIVTVVDARNVRKQLQRAGSPDDANEAERQIAYADTILLNKVRSAHLRTGVPPTYMVSCGT